MMGWVEHKCTMSVAQTCIVVRSKFDHRLSQEINLSACQLHDALFFVNVETTNVTAIKKLPYEY